MFWKCLQPKNIDLEIKQGEFLTLLGPSGSGKTTFAGMISRLYLTIVSMTFTRLLTSDCCIFQED